jgi:hypothetical protein
MGRTDKEEQLKISCEISLAGASTMRRRFGCIFKATADRATRLWWALYVRIMGI